MRITLAIIHVFLLIKCSFSAVLSFQLNNYIIHSFFLIQYLFMKSVLIKIINVEHAVLHGRGC